MPAAVFFAIIGLFAFFAYEPPQEVSQPIAASTEAGEEIVTAAEAVEGRHAVWEPQGAYTWHEAFADPAHAAGNPVEHLSEETVVEEPVEIVGGESTAIIEEGIAEESVDPASPGSGFALTTDVGLREAEEEAIAYREPELSEAVLVLDHEGTAQEVPASAEGERSIVEKLLPESGIAFQPQPEPESHSQTEPEP